MIKIAYLFSFILLLTACNKNEEAESMDETSTTHQKSAKEEAPSPEIMTSDFKLSANASGLTSNSTTAASVPVQTDKKIIRNAVIRYQVKEHKQSALTIEKIVKNHGAYIANSSEQNTNYSGTLQTSMNIRVLNSKFDDLVNSLLKEAIYVEQKNITSEDVTTQFIDTQARLKAKKEVENRYVELLKKAKTVEEILQIENQLAIIREEIEAKEGVLKYLSDQVDYSTINLEFYERIEGQVQPEDGFFTKIGRGIEQGWDLLLNFIIGVFYIWPLILLVTLIVFFLIRRNRKSKAKVS